MRKMINKTSALLLLAALALLGTALTVAAQRADDADRKSKNGKTEGTIDGVDVVIEYGRPNVQGRKVWGELVPYGETWRTGADEATTISFSKDVTIEGKKLPAGKYSLFTVPGEKEWQVVFNKEAKQWGAYKYKADQDALRVSVTPEPAAATETLTFAIEGSSVVLRWEKLAVSFDVAAS